MIFHEMDGSSPRLWGTLLRDPAGRIIIRFIPTPVGNTQLETFEAIIHPVHPHACGEHLPKKIYQIVTTGSSPRLWGTPVAAAADLDTERFIPTPVGNTLTGSTFSTLKTVHPHACGEHFANSPFSPRLNGSSPRLWGTLILSIECAPSGRFIPTPVGNTVPMSQNLFLGAVHPHACGEHLKTVASASNSSGSSPRLWGTLFLEHAEIKKFFL